MRFNYIALTSALAFVACAQPQQEEEVDEGAIQSTTQAITTSATTAVSFTAPISVASDEGSPDAPLGDMEVKAMVETSVGQSGIVVDPSCVSYSWAGLTATATFTGCVLVVSGATLDGTITLTVTTMPLGVSLGFTNLTVGGASVDGSIGLYLAGKLGALEAHLEADLDIANGGRSVSFDPLSVVTDGSGVTASGQAAVVGTAESEEVDITDLHWNYGVCLPVSGSLYFEEGTIPITITFLATTPNDGVVLVQIGSQPAAKMQLLQPCAQ